MLTDAGDEIVTFRLGMKDAQKGAKISQGATRCLQIG